MLTTDTISIPLYTIKCKDYHDKTEYVYGLDQPQQAALRLARKVGGWIELQESPSTDDNGKIHA